MAKYTIELGELKESGVKIFNFDYEFYDETKKPDFEEMFVNHFYFREIGQETVLRFQHYLKCMCKERLPYYNALLKLNLLQYDPLKPYNLTEELTKTTSDTKTGTIASTASGTAIGDNTRNADTTTTEDRTETRNENNKVVGSDTPSGLLAMADIETNVYASKADIQTGDGTTVNDISQTNAEDVTEHSITETESQGNTTQNENNTGTEDYTINRHGHIGVQTASELLIKHTELLKIIQTVYTQFFNECENLFMQIY